MTKTMTKNIGALQQRRWGKTEEEIAQKFLKIYGPKKGKKRG